MQRGVPLWVRVLFGAKEGFQYLCLLLRAGEQNGCENEMHLKVRGFSLILGGLSLLKGKLIRLRYRCIETRKLLRFCWLKRRSRQTR